MALYNIKPSVNIYNLQFEDQKLEDNYNSFFLSNSRLLHRWICLVAIFLYAIYGVLDIWMIPNSLSTVWGIRFLIVIPVFLVVFTLSYFDNIYKKYAPIYTTICMFISGLGIIEMIALSTKTEYSNIFYFTGLSLVIIGIYSIITIQFKYATISSWILTITYFLSLLFIQNIINDSIYKFLNNLFFFISINTVGMVLSYSSEYNLRKNYFLLNYIEENNIILNSTLSELHTTQERLVQSEKIAALGHLIGGIAHNLKTPLTTVSAGLEIIKNASDSNNQEQVNQWVENLRQQCRYMTDVISTVRKQMINFSEKNSTIFSVDELLKRVLILLEHFIKLNNGKLTIINDLKGEFYLQGDIAGLIQVIENLILNALQSYPNNTDAIEHEVKLSLRNQDNNIIICVEDKGCGISLETKNKLFKEMITTKGKNGTGIGLYVSYATIKAKFDGELSFEDVPDGGTRFIISIPQHL